eukprot:TRINITY_DN420_c0_g1_i2.p1 TRINITY_DN420_c0_g1~~TRINITY_DN420_c0_g1_i2.p1  ORF type:complete len:190 (-),score=34.45 TRINITY_DN420_c0_g1_i2:178-747(-)
MEEDHGLVRGVVENPIDIDTSAHFDLLESDENRQAFAPFVHVTEAREADLLKELQHVLQDSNTQRKASMKQSVSASCCYGRIDQRIRYHLRRYTGPGVAHFEAEILQFVSDGSTSNKLTTPHKINDAALVLVCADAFERMLCHAVCQYHALACHSHNAEHGPRTTVIMRPKLRHVHPDIRLSEHLTARV